VKEKIIGSLFFTYICHRKKSEQKTNKNISNKKMKKLLVIAITIATLFSAKSFAQSPKFGHINSGELIQMMPGLKNADAQLETYQKSLEEQMKSMVADYQTMVQDYQVKEKLMTDAVKEIKQKEIGQKEKLIQDFQQSAQEKVAAKKEELYNPILKKAESAIKDVAKKNGYAYVFDTSVGAFLYAQDSDNIMELVKKELNITTPTAPMNGTATPVIQQAPKK
jgi:outer membrane protein